MLEILRQILTDPVTYLLVVALGGARIALTRQIQRGVDHRFDERLETHKQKLMLLTERAKTDYQRELADFTLYAQRRHSAAETVYAAVRVAHGHISNLFGLSRSLTFEEFNTEDITTYMTGHDIPRGKQDEILRLWTADREAAKRILLPYLRVMTVQEAERKFIEAKNKTFLNELYLSDDVIGALTRLFSIMTDWVWHADHERQLGDRWRPDHEALNAALDAVHTLLRAHLNPIPGTTAVQPAPSAE